MNYLSGSLFELVEIHINIEFLFYRFLAGPIVVVIATYKIPKWER